MNMTPPSTEAPPGDGVAENPAAEDPAAESVDSISTKEYTIENKWKDIHTFRERKVLLGGILSRPIKTFRKEEVRMHPPNCPPEEEESRYYAMYVLLELYYWQGELKAWESNLWHIRRRWEIQNEEAGGTIPPPPPVTEMDPVELQTVYLKLLRTKLEMYEPRRDGWHFMLLDQFQEHIRAVEKMVADLKLRKERGLSELPMSDEKAQNSTDPILSSNSPKREMKQEDVKREESVAEAQPTFKKQRRLNKPSTAARKSLKRTRDDKPNAEAPSKPESPSQNTRKQSLNAPAPKIRNAGGARSRNKTSTAAATAARNPRNQPIAGGRQAEKRNAKADISEGNATDLGDLHTGTSAPDKKPPMGRVGPETSVSGQSSQGIRYSRRLKGMKPQNDGL